MIDTLTDELALMNRNLEILRIVCRHEPIGIVLLSKQTGYPRHQVRHSLGVLETNGLIEPSPQGAVATAQLPVFLDALDEQCEQLTDRISTLRLTPSAP